MGVGENLLFFHKNTVELVDLRYVFCDYVFSGLLQDSIVEHTT